MEPINLPPKNLSLPSIIKAVSEQRATQNSDRLEPHMLFLPHDVSRRMSEQLKKENSDIHIFAHQACVQYLNQVDNEQKALDKWLALSEMQLNESSSWSGWGSDEDIFGKEQTIIKLDKDGNEEGE